MVHNNVDRIKCQIIPLSNLSDEHVENREKELKIAFSSHSHACIDTVAIVVEILAVIYVFRLHAVDKRQTRTHTHVPTHMIKRWVPDGVRCNRHNWRAYACAMCIETQRQTQAHASNDKDWMTRQQFNGKKRTLMCDMWWVMCIQFVYFFFRNALINGHCFVLMAVAHKCTHMRMQCLLAFRSQLYACNAHTQTLTLIQLSTNSPHFLSLSLKNCLQFKMNLNGPEKKST